MSGFSFGGAPSTTTTTTGNFAFAPKTAAAPTFGAPSTSGTFGSPAPAFGTTNTAMSSFGFGGQTPIASAAPNFNFGTLATAATTTASALQQQPTNTTTASTFGLGATNFSFGKPATATTLASINFGTTTTTSLGSGLFAKAATTTTPATTTTTTPFVGLGGIDFSSTQPKAGDCIQDIIKIKETQVPDEIAKTVDDLKSYIKIQKTLSSDIGRTSTSKLTNVSSEIINFKWVLPEMSNAVESNYNLIKLLRKETSRTIQSVEMAQRTQDTPVGLQFENNAPFQFFESLVMKYEQDLIAFREQIALIERHMHSLMNPEIITPDDIKSCFRHINGSFISLAGRLHQLHEKIEEQKEQYLNLRKYRLRDNSDVFAKLDDPETAVDTTRITAGPTPFSNISAISSFGKSFNNSAAAATTATQSAK
uniref:Uncharacterized protein n=1 Tax=Glossina brevipalpis TaxID=37001 RepID=A0A1A9WTX7_9MUSC